MHQFAVDASSAQRNISQEIPVQSVQQSRERYPGVVKQQSAMVISAAAQALPPALEQNATVVGGLLVGVYNALVLIMCPPANGIL